jgi:formylglycine-generating enzyme
MGLLAVATAALAIGGGCELLLPPGDLNPQNEAGLEGSTAHDAPDDRLPDDGSDVADRAPCTLTAIPMQSCASDAGSTCGSTGTESCCATLRVEGGTFFRTAYALNDAEVADAFSPATVQSFYLDKYEVTVGRFKRFTEQACIVPAADAGAHPGIPGSGWDPNFTLPAQGSDLANDVSNTLNSPCRNGAPTFPIDGGDHLPVNCVTWEEAFAFCVWDGGRLPTDVEWNYAAAGGKEERYYPWSSPPWSKEIDANFAVYFGAPFIEPVGSKPDGKGLWNQLDLAGNVAEYVLDFYLDHYPACDAGPCAALDGGPGAERASWGGLYSQQASSLATWKARQGIGMTQHAGGRGLRCARDSL